MGRTPEAIAEAFSVHLEGGTGRANLLCLDQDEAAAVALRLKRMGWKAKAEQGLQGMDEIKVVHYVRVTGRGKGRG